MTKKDYINIGKQIMKKKEYINCNQTDNETARLYINVEKQIMKKKNI